MKRYDPNPTATSTTSQTTAIVPASQPNIQSISTTTTSDSTAQTDSVITDNTSTNGNTITSKDASKIGKDKNSGKFVMFGEESVNTFFRRLCWTVDGSLLLAPFGISLFLVTFDTLCSFLLENYYSMKGEKCSSNWYSDFALLTLKTCKFTHSFFSNSFLTSLSQVIMSTRPKENNQST